MNFVFYPLIILSGLLQLVLVVLLCLGPFKRYPALFLYSAAQLMLGMAEGLVYFDAGRKSILYRNLYWTTDVVLDLSLFLMVITVTYAVLEGNPLRPKAGRVLAIMVAAVMILPFLLFHPLFTSRWFRHTSQMLSFGAAIMNLVLWTAILGSRRRDSEIIAVSAGLGVAVTGVVVTYGVGMFVSAGARPAVDLFMALTHIASMAIWCWAFRPKGASSPTPRETLPGPFSPTSSEY